MMKKMAHSSLSYLVSGALAGAAALVTWEGAVAGGAMVTVSGGVGVAIWAKAPVVVEEEEEVEEGGAAITADGILL